MLLDIVILPPKKLRENVGLRSRRASKGMKFKYLIDNRELIPHVSLFHLRTNRPGYRAVQRKLQAIIKSTAPFFMKAVGLESPKGSGYFWIRYRNSQQFKILHRRVLSSVHGLRRGRIISRSLKEPSVLQSRYWKKYGSPYILKLLTPHITIGRLDCVDEGLETKVVAKFGALDYDFRAADIGICTINHDCQVTKILKIYQLK